MTDDLLININWMEKDVTLDFLCTDEETLLKNNKKKLGKEWKYFDLPITYKMNKSGYRMNKNFDEIDYDNYITFFGCSYTIGIGLPLEDTFAYRIAEKANCDYINAGIYSCGADLVYTNFLHFLSRMPKKPKCIVFLWPELTRKFYWYDNYIMLLSSSNKNLGTNGFWDKAYKSFIMEESNMFNTFSYMRIAIKLLCETNEIPYMETTHLQSSENFTKFNEDIEVLNYLHPELTEDKFADPKTLHVNNGRDVMKISKYKVESHPGTYMQQTMIDKFFTKMGHLFND